MAGWVIHCRPTRHNPLCLERGHAWISPSLSLCRNPYLMDNEDRGFTTERDCTSAAFHIFHTGCFRNSPRGARSSARSDVKWHPWSISMCIFVYFFGMKNCSSLHSSKGWNIPQCTEYDQNAATHLKPNVFFCFLENWSAATYSSKFRRCTSSSTGLRRRTNFTTTTTRPATSTYSTPSESSLILTGSSISTFVNCSMIRISPIGDVLYHLNPHWSSLAPQLRPS